MTTKNHSIAREFKLQYSSRRRQDLDTYTTSMLSDSVLGRQRVSSISYSGSRKTVRLLLSDGVELRATPDHRVMTSAGWVELGALTGNLKVLCEGDKGGRYKFPKKMYKMVGGLVFHPYCDRTVSPRDGRLYRVPFHRLVAEASLNGIGIAEFIFVCKNDITVASCLSFLDPVVWAVHHKDDNHTNNNPINLEVMTHIDHGALHGKDHYFHFGHTIKEVSIRKVDSPKQEDTYDLTCADGLHPNFLANGVVIHNSGKSLTAFCQATLSGARTAFLTSTKALGGQYFTEFAEAGLIEIRGLNSYECIEGRATGRFGDTRREGFRAGRGLPMACDEAPCQVGAFCPKRGNGCLYYDAYGVACNYTTRLLVTNYAYWMSIHRYGQGLGKFDMLVLDEVHNAVDELANHVGTEIRPAEIVSLLGVDCLTPTASLGDWRDWGGYRLASVTCEIEHIKLTVQEMEKSNSSQMPDRISHNLLRRAKDLRRIEHKLATIATMTGEWIIDWAEDSLRRSVIKFDPVWPGEYAESLLFLNIPKIVMVSATVRPKTAHMLGVRPEAVDFKEYPSTFNKANRPIIYCPAMCGGAPVHMNKNVSDAGKQAWAAHIDHIIARRPDVKGIIHTVSYGRAREFYAASEFKERLLMHDATNTRDVIAEFKASRHPVVLVSPVLDTGYDFLGDLCRFQVIGKIPFPVTVDKVMKARTARDKEYKDYVTAIKLVQMAGRIVRADYDWGETIIADGDFAWWYNRFGAKLVPHWFAESVRYEQFLGAPMRGLAT